MNTEIVFSKSICGIEYHLEYDDVFSTALNKQYFLVVDGELEEEIYTFHNTPEALDRLILQYNNDLQIPTNSTDLLFLMQNAYNAGRSDKAKEMTELIDTLKSVISDYD